MFKKHLFFILNVLLLLVSICVQAKRPEYTLTIKNHLFYPAELVIPADQKVKLIINNHDTTPEEFDSFDLNREKVIFPNSKSVIYLGPLTPGRYEFFGEYNPSSARGVVVVMPKNAITPENSVQLVSGVSNAH